jgi:membrane protease YdiL (CAAX protease family)
MKRRGLRKRSHGGNKIPTRNRKRGLRNPAPTAGASELYPNPGACECKRFGESRRGSVNYRGLTKQLKGQAIRSESRLCWLEWTVLGFGLLALIAGISRLVAYSVPAARHGSVEQRYVWSLLGGVLAEWLLVIAAWVLLNSRGLSFKDFGTWRLGNWKAWTFALVFAELSIASNLRFFRMMGVPISNAFAPRGLHLVAALLTGITAGFCEEFLFRGFLMTEFAGAGYGRSAQVILPGISFGFSHLGYSVHGFLPAVGIMVPTAILGMMWGVAYLLGRRSLVPCTVAHFLNDYPALPWIGFFMFKGSLG